MNWFSSSPPFLWQWIGLIAGLTALLVAVMTLPTAAQMIWGKPNIEISFKERGDKRENTLFLSCLFYNRPIENRFLRILRVYRRAVDSMSVFFSIENIRESRMVVTDIIAQIYSTHDTPKASVSLPTSILPTTIDLVKAMHNGKANTIAHYEPKNIDLPAGKYRAIIRIETSEKENKYSKEFTVGLKPEDLRWGSM